MKRKIIQIDEARCNGCGRCIPNCHEGALQLIDGKARLISDLFCDGLGACLGECPQGAIRIVEREAEPYDERKVMAVLAGKGENTIKAHLKHLLDHRENALYDQAVAYLKEHAMAVPSATDEPPPLPCGCPGSLAKRIAPRADSGAKPVAAPSALRQWPVQLRLVSADAGYFDGADLLIAADCVAYACGGFHADLLAGRILLVFCPKLDRDLDEYVEKLAAIFRRRDIHSVTVARMEVPCCGGTVAVVEKALQLAGKQYPLNVRIVGIDGSIQS